MCQLSNVQYAIETYNTDTKPSAVLLLLLASRFSDMDSNQLLSLFKLFISFYKYGINSDIHTAFTLISFNHHIHSKIGDRLGIRMPACLRMKGEHVRKKVSK